MPGSLSNFLENKLLDHVLRNTTYTPPATLYLALFTVAQNDAGSGGTEVTGGSYARQTITFDAAASGATQNTGTVDFTGMPACTVVGIGLYDALTSGNLLLHGTLTTSRTLASGDTLRIQIGELDISLD